MLNDSHLSYHIMETSQLAQRQTVLETHRHIYIYTYVCIYIRIRIRMYIGATCRIMGGGVGELYDDEFQSCSPHDLLI